MKCHKGHILHHFQFSRIKNEGLVNDIYAEIDNEKYSILLLRHGLEKSDSVIVSFDGNFSYCKVNGVQQISGFSLHNFNDIVLYELEDSVGNKATYSVLLKSSNGIPRVDIITEDKKEIASKEQ